MNPTRLVIAAGREPDGRRRRLISMHSLLAVTRFTVAITALTMLATACGDDEPATVTDGSGTDGATGTVIDREFWSTDLIIDGAPFELVDGTRIQLRFDPEQINASAGCNQLGGGYTIDGDRIVVGDMFMTEMGCDPERHAQDDLLIAFLADGPRVALDGDTLTLTTANGDTIEFLDKTVAEPDRSIESGWEITGFFDELAAWSHAVTRPQSLSLDEGLLKVSDGCGESESTASLDGDTITFEPPSDWPPCDGPVPEPTEDLRRVLAAGELEIDIDGRALRLTAPDGTGISATAVE